MTLIAVKAILYQTVIGYIFHIWNINIEFYLLRLSHKILFIYVIK